MILTSLTSEYKKKTPLRNKRFRSLLNHNTRINNKTSKMKLKFKT